MKTINAETIAIKLTQNIAKYPFSENQNFANKKIVGIEAHLLANIGKSPNGDTVCNATAQKNSFLTIQAGGKEAIKDQPINSLVLANRNGMLFEVEELIMALPKSYVYFSNSSDISTGEVLLLTFYYKD